MPDFELPDGWVVDSWSICAHGRLAIALDYRSEAQYTVYWHIDDSVTQTGYSAAGKPLAYDPTVTALGLCWAAQHCLTPRYPRDVAQHN